MQRDIRDIVETLKKAKDRNKACTLLIGAGCSVKAGIPLAGEFVEIIGKEYPYKYSQVKEKTYPHCMAALSMGERRDLISKYIDNAKINWAHIGIAQLMKHDFVDRILTVNFDPLLQRACGMVGVFPAVYDFAASQYFNPGFIADQSIFHLHGQRSGFVVLNTLEEVEKLSRHLKPVFDDALRGRVCIVVGYSGENDPVFTNLAAIERFDNNLYWVGYKDSEPAGHVRDRLLLTGRDAFYVSGYDADDFFVTLAQQLECFPPDFVGTPFSHLLNLVNAVNPYSLPGQTVSVADSAAAMIQEAIGRFETGSAGTAVGHPLALKANDLLLAGKYNEVIKMSSDYTGSPSPELADVIAWAYIALGDEKSDRAALTKSGKEADRLFKQAYEKYEAATRIKPDRHEAFYNWGIALEDQARTKSGKEANRLFKQSYDMYDAATRIEPEYTDAFNNWGIALAENANRKSGKEADRLFSQAFAKYEAASQTKPDDHEVFSNWGIALSENAKRKSGKEADRLFKQSYEKYQAATQIKPDYPEALYNWGFALASQARTKNAKEADRLFVQSYEKYQAATQINPDLHEAFYNWANALKAQASTKSGEEADRLFAQVYEKYDAATQIKPHDHEALNNWGIALSDQALTKSGEEADELFARSHEKYEAATQIKPDDHKALINWAIALWDQALTKRGEEADGLFAQSYEKYEEASRIEPDDHVVFTNWGNAISAQAEAKSGTEADALRALADEKFETARRLEQAASKIE